MPATREQMIFRHARAKLHFASLVVIRTMITTQRFLDGDFDWARVVRRQRRHSRMKEAGSANFSFRYGASPSKYSAGPAAVKHAIDQIDAVREQCAGIPRDRPGDCGR